MKRTICRKETRLAAEIFKSMKNRESSLYQNKLFLAGVFVDARYRILLTEEQVEVAKTGLMEVALKWHRCSSYACSSSIDDSVVESIQVDDTITEPNSSSPSDEDDFERELDWLERRRSPRSCLSNDSDSFSQVAEKVKTIENLEEPLRTTAKILSAMPITHVSVERLFSSMRFILNDQRSSTKQDLLEAILLLQANGDDNMNF